MDAPRNSESGRQRVSVSLVIPAFNEQDIITQAVTEAVAALSQVTNDFEVLVVDDGSTDDTSNLVHEAAGEYPQVRLIRQPENCGYGAALRRGFSEATKDLVAFTDADCQFDLRELDRFVLLARDYPIVCGYRIDRKDSWLRCFYSATYNVLVRGLLGTGVRDCDCALKLFRRETLKQLPITTDGFLVNGELLANARQQGLPVVEVGVSHRPRAGGESKVSLTHIPIVFAELLRFWWNRVQFPGARQSQIGQWSWQKQTAISLLLLAVATLLLLPNLNYALIEPDESRYAQISLEMYESGDWLTPRLHGEPYLDKPPLLYWITAGCFRVFGISEASSRLPCAISAILTVLATYLMGRRLLGDPAACIGALLLLMCGGYIAAGRFIMMDGPLSLFTTVAILAVVRGLSTQNAVGWWALCGAALGLGILTKGPVAPVLCMPPVIALAWLTQNREVLSLKNLAAALVPACAIAAPWFVMIAAEQSEFIGYFFWKHNIVRYTNAFDHQQPWWFYLPMLALGMLPVSLLLPALWVYLGRKNHRAALVRTSEMGAVLLSVAWIVGFFSLSSCKLVTYILPVYPLLALALGKLVVDIDWSAISANCRVRTWARYAAWNGTSLVCWVAVGGIILQLSLDPATQPLAAVASLVPVAVLSLLYGRWLSSSRRLLAVAVASYMFVAFYGFGFVVPEFAKWKSISHSAARIRSEMRIETPVVYFGRKCQAAALTTSGRVVEFSTDQVTEFQQFMTQQCVAVVVANPGDCRHLREKCGNTMTLVGPQARSRVYVATSHAEVARTIESADTVVR